MRAVIERVSQMKITADGVVRGEKGQGLVIFLGISPIDTEIDADVLSKKISAMRIFSDEAGKMNLSVNDVNGSVAIISNFTLYACCKKGNRPDFFGSAKPDLAARLYEYFVDKMRQMSSSVITGIFGADMQVVTACDGPVTIVLDSEELIKGKK